MSFWKNQHVIVTGGAGFIGSHVVKKLVSEGADVQVIDNLWRGNLNNLKNDDGRYIFNPEDKFHLIDLTEYSKCLENIRDVDWVFHLADVVGGVKFAFENEMFIFRQNILINTNVLTSAIKNGIPNYIYAGTACSFPKHLQMAKEIAYLAESQTYPAHPESSYGWSKLMGEYEAELAQTTKRINIGLLRFHNVYGPGAPYEGDRAQVLPSLMRKVINYPKEPFVIWGSGNQYRDFIYIDDVVDALLRVGQFGMNHGLIQVGSEKPTTIREAAELIVELSQKDVAVSFDTSKPEGDLGRVGICTRAHEILNWHPRVPFKEGLKITMEWINAQMRNQ